MKVRTTLTVQDVLTGQTGARLQAFMLNLAPTLIEPSIKVESGEPVMVGWTTTKGTIAEAAAMWFPMLLACWVHVDRRLESTDITQAHFEEIA